VLKSACLATAFAAAVAASACAEEVEKPRLYSRSGRFRIKVRRNNKAPVSAILLQVHDPSEGRWIGDQHFVLWKGEAPADGEAGYAVFSADEEGTYPLRSIGHFQPDEEGARPIVEPHSATDPPTACDIIAVYDATAPVVELIEPMGGETFASGADVQVLWSADDSNPLAKGCVKIEVSADSGLTWDPVAAGCPPVGRIIWKLPEGPGAGLRLRVSAIDAAGNSSTAESNEFRRLPSDRKVVEVEPGAAEKRPAAEETVPTDETGMAAEARPSSSPAAQKPKASDRAAAVKHYRKGVVYLLRGDYDEAAGLLEKAVESDPAFISARIDLSVAYASDGRIRKAKTLLTRSMELFPQELAFRYNLGRLYYREGDHASAVKQLGGALSIKPGHVESLWLLGDIYARREELGSARHYWQEVIENAAPGNRWRRKAEVYLATSYGAVGSKR